MNVKSILVAIALVSALPLVAQSETSTPAPPQGVAPAADSIAPSPGTGVVSDGGA